MSGLLIGPQGPKGETNYVYRRSFNRDGHCAWRRNDHSRLRAQSRWCFRSSAKATFDRGHLDVAVAIGMVWLLDIHLVTQFTGDMRSDWIGWVVDGVVIVGMIPVKDAVVGAIAKGMRA